MTNTANTPNTANTRDPNTGVQDAFDEARAAGAAAVDEVRRRRARKGDTREDVDAEHAALNACVTALHGVDDVARTRILLYLSRRYTPVPDVDPRPYPDPSGGR